MALKKRKPVRLNAREAELAGQMNDLANDNPKLSFVQAIAKAGITFNDNTPSGRFYRAECKKIFDRERS